MYIATDEMQIFCTTDANKMHRNIVDITTVTNTFTSSSTSANLTVKNKNNAWESHTANYYNYTANKSLTVSGFSISVIQNSKDINDVQFLLHDAMLVW